jgi:hypothetical protein
LIEGAFEPAAICDTGLLESQDKNASSRVYERALKEMMNGELNSKSAMNQIWVLEKPAWMFHNAIEWTDEQKQLAAQFQTEQKRINEIRETRRQALEAEVCLHMLQLSTKQSCASSPRQNPRHNRAHH